MGRKIFISYKYADNSIRQICDKYNCTVRDYVDVLQDKLDDDDHINKGENDGEDMSFLADSTIASKLGDKIYDSSITIILISPNMKKPLTKEKDQWIPWEVSYSLREQSRAGKTSKTNAMIAVVLPDINGSYEYFIKEHTCLYCNSTTYHTNTLFNILSSNMFNRITPEFSSCEHHQLNKPQLGYCSYIHCVKWDDFIDNYSTHLVIAERIRDNHKDYNIRKNLD